MILITGGSGFIGTHLIRELSKENQVRVIDRQLPKQKLDGVEYIKADITKDLSASLSDVESVYHLAAEIDVRSSVKEPKETFQTNMIGSFNLLEASRNSGVKNFNFASSGGTVYGENKEILTEKTSLNPISPYGASKAAFELYLGAYASTYGLNATALRYGNIIGPGSTHGVTYDFFNKLKQNPKELLVLGDGNQEKSFLHVSDCVNGTIIASKKTKGYEAYNVSGDGTLKIKELAKIVSKTLKLNPSYKFTGQKKAWTGDINKTTLDNSKLKSLGWSLKFTQEEAVISQVEWLIKNFGF